MSMAKIKSEDIAPIVLPEAEADTTDTIPATWKVYRKNGKIIKWELLPPQ